MILFSLVAKANSNSLTLNIIFVMNSYSLSSVT